MIAIGEETGNIEAMLDKVAEYYEEEAELATQSMSELMQPVIIVVLGGIVGWMVLAMYSPMINMYGDMGGL
jgi:type IV pilus assembly protein PilC